ncbi:hypothetical protein KP509_06G029200 [Ceratopteris richardii]|uniref:50S ribosomal protein 5, chloroplastic n=2 Tax=Ceratopteris richardii TaxID=49495 RepID=A0A8T2UEI4_CERRI|nr:hypothetical protein KP509_06G029200 [Ceratopteris richardii]
MVSVTMATISSACSSAPAVVSPNSTSSLRQALPQPLFSRAKLNLPKDVIATSCFSSGGVSTQWMLQCNDQNLMVTRAVAETLIGNPSTELEEDASSTEVLKIKLESDLLKKKAKRAELRRRRLVRKRRLRKKGKWPPSKMAKLKNV